MDEVSRQATRIGSEDPTTHQLRDVREGMEVVDAAGDRLGKVAAVRMGDPEAATTQGNEPATGQGLLGILAGATGSPLEQPDLPEPQRSQYLRVGFIKVSGHGPFAADHYVRADLIADVSGETVKLAVRRDEAPASG
jgi:hypothetical protein